MTTPQLRKGEFKMKTYQVEITRTVKQSAYVEIEAEDEVSAIDEAEAAAWDLDDDDWSIDVDNRDYETGKVTVINEEEEEESA